MSQYLENKPWFKDKNTYFVFWQWAVKFVQQEEAFVSAGVFLPNSV